MFLVIAVILVTMLGVVLLGVFVPGEIMKDCSSKK